MDSQPDQQDIGRRRRKKKNESNASHLHVSSSLFFPLHPQVPAASVLQSSVDRVISAAASETMRHSKITGRTKRCV